MAVIGVLGLRLAMASAAARPVTVGALGAGGVTTGRGSPGSTPVSTAAQMATARSATSSGGDGPAASPLVSPSAVVGTATGAAPPLVVYVSGRVRHPGVLRLTAGSRVQDALRAAGGALPRSDVTSINLAQPLSDGEQVLVARAGSGSSVSGGGQGVTPAAGAGGTSGAVIDLNAADLAALDSLPGVGPVLAQRIIDWRTAHGRFTNVDELDEVSGIGDKLMAQIRPHVRA
jgi:competence protein ComEA